MTRNKIIFAVVCGLFVAGIASTFFGYMGWSNEARQFEADIPAQYAEMQNVYDNGWKQIMEQNQIADKYANQVKDIFQGVMSGRYGADGSKAIFQMIKESNPNVDPSLLKKVSESIESFHATFAGAQRKLIAEKQSYQGLVTATTSGRFFNSFGGYPHIKCGVPAGSADDFQIVTSDKTQKDFQQHKAEQLNLSQRQ